MIKNRLKSIILAIAVFEIVMVNNIGFGAFVGVASLLENRVDARPTFSRENSQIKDIKTIRTIRRRNYPAALKYSSPRLTYTFLDNTWNEGAKDVEQKLREEIDGKQIDRGDRIHDMIIKSDAIYLDDEKLSFDPTSNKGIIVRRMTKKIQFKTTSPATLGAERESTFLGEFNLRIEVKFRTTNQSRYLDDLITVDSVKVTTDNFRLDSNANDTTEEAVSRFYREKLESAIFLSAHPSVKTRWAGYIESALQRIVPVNILLTR